MGSDIELVIDDDGIALFGDPSEIDLFLSTAGVTSREIALRPSTRSALNVASSAAQAGSQIAAHSGRWVQLTEESAKALKLGRAMKGSSGGVSRAIATTDKGKITKVLEFVKPGQIGSMLTNPAMLAGAAGIMAQLAMQQTMEEITQYLAVIDEKVDDVLRAQKDSALSEMIGVGLVLDDAMLKRAHVGRVSETTWSNLHGAAQAIATSQSYALRQLDALAGKLEKKRKVGDLAKLSREAEIAVEDWLAVLARCFQLQDGLAVLELDRVLDASPDEVDRHREAIQAGRRHRRDLIANTTQRVLERMDTAAGLGNTDVLLHPMKSNAIVRSGNEVGVDVVEFHTTLGIQQGRDALESKRWGEAVDDAREQIFQAAEDGAGATARFGVKAFKSAKSLVSDVSTNIADRFGRDRDNEADEHEKPQ